MIFPVGHSRGVILALGKAFFSITLFTVAFRAAFEAAFGVAFRVAFRAAFGAAFGAAFRAAFRAAFGVTFGAAFKAPRADAGQATVNFKGLIPFLGAILGPNSGCGRSLSIVVAEVDCPIDELFAAVEALVLTPFDARGRFKRWLTLAAFSGTTILKKVSIERLYINL